MINHVYIHIPFCIKKCGYCSFYSETFTQELCLIYIKALKKEIKQFLQNNSVKADTIYFGGGTPSLLSVDLISDILSLFERQDNCEITLETNPGTVDSNYFNQLKEKTPVNRISLGVQSLDEKELKYLQRIHSAEQVYKTVKDIKAVGFDNFSLDLIYGLPDQSIEQVLASLRKMVELNPAHISIYNLSLEKDAPLYGDLEWLPNDDLCNRMYYSILEYLDSESYNIYELSNFAETGKESRHNLSYWNYKNYAGFGAGASGFVNNIRYKNPEDLQEYYRIVNDNHMPDDVVELTESDMISEYAFLNLRKTEGLNRKDFKSRFNRDFSDVYGAVTAKLMKQELLEEAGDYIRLTPEAYFVSNSVFMEFLIEEI